MKNECKGPSKEFGGKIEESNKKGKRGEIGISASNLG